MKSKRNLCHTNDIGANNTKQIFAKVCCSCDCFIKFGDEKLLMLKNLLNHKVVKLMSSSTQNWHNPEIKDSVKHCLNSQYTQTAVKNAKQCHHPNELKVRAKDHATLSSLLLSPKSYATMKGNKNILEHAPNVSIT